LGAWRLIQSRAFASDLARKGREITTRIDDSRSDSGRSDDGGLVLSDVVVVLVLGGLSRGQSDGLDGQTGVGELGVAVSK